MDKEHIDRVLSLKEGNYIKAVRAENTNCGYIEYSTLGTVYKVYFEIFGDTLSLDSEVENIG